MDEVDRTEAVSRYIGVPIKTLEHWRHTGTGPAYSRLGKHVRYRRADVDSWLEAHTTRPDREVVQGGASAA